MSARELTAEEEAQFLKRAVAASIAWARQVRLEAEALEQLLQDDDDEPSNVLAICGRRSSVASGG